MRADSSRIAYLLDSLLAESTTAAVAAAVAAAEPVAAAVEREGQEMSACQ